MTKARDLAGFSTGSITNTTADGLILKGDGSSTDVVIKNGADATVATVSDGSTNLSVAGSVTGALARGAIQVGNSSGVAAALAKGTSGYVLTAGANDLSWAEGGGGGLTFIASTDASDTATISFTGFDSSKYDSYLFTFLNVVSATDAKSLLLLTSSDGGSNYDSGSSDYAVQYFGYRNASVFSGMDLTSANINVSVGQGTASGEEGGCSGHMFIYSPHLALPTRVAGQSVFFNSSTYFSNTVTAGQRNSSADVDAVRFYYNSGNIASGTITMYGMVNS